MKKIKVKNGDVIIKEGLQETCAYIIDSGSVEVSTIVNNHKSILTTLGKGEIFGEMGLIEDVARSATITALENTALTIIDRKSFNNLYTCRPKLILPIVRSLFERIRSTTKLAEANTLDKNNGHIDIDKKESPPFVNSRHIIISGANNVSKDTLRGAGREIRKFPFKVGRYSTGDTMVKKDVFSNNDLYITENDKPYYVSKNHFLIDKVDEGFIVVDRGSISGVIVNDKPIKKSCVLKAKKNSIVVGSNFSPFVFNVEVRH